LSAPRAVSIARAAAMERAEKDTAESKPSYSSATGGTVAAARRRRRSVRDATTAAAVAAAAAARSSTTRRCGAMGGSGGVATPTQQVNSGCGARRTRE
jgi:hypothetical protein